MTLPPLLVTLAVMLLYAVGIVIFIAASVIFLVWMERKVSAHIQSRLGPMKTGFHGWAQTIADMIKILFKEDVIPAGTDKWVFVSASFVLFVPALLSYLIIPFGPKIIARDLNVGLLYFLAIPSVGVLGIIMAGWGSNNKYSFLGGMRSAAQLIGYEAPRALSVLSIALMAGTMSTISIVQAQKIPFLLVQPLAFIIFFIASLAETNHIPFDLPEAEAELVMGYHLEYSGIRWAIFMLAEYANLFAAAAMATILFLGGWKGFLLPGPIWFLLKAYAIIFVVMWLRWTLPRFRMDQMMNLCWKVLLPLSLLNLGLTAAAVTLGSSLVGG